MPSHYDEQLDKLKEKAKAAMTQKERISEKYDIVNNIKLDKDYNNEELDYGKSYKTRITETGAYHEEDIPEQYDTAEPYEYDTAQDVKIIHKFNEGKYVEELKTYIDSTYLSHYSGSKYQATDLIIDAGHGEGFCIGNIIKYSKRYGKKNGYNRKDLLKILHYATIMLYVHDTKEGDK